MHSCPWGTSGVPGAAAGFSSCPQHSWLSSSTPGLLEAQALSLGSCLQWEGSCPSLPSPLTGLEQTVPLPLALPFLSLVPSPPLFFLFSSPPICPSHIRLFWAEFLTVSVVGTVVQLLSLEDEQCLGKPPQALTLLGSSSPPCLDPVLKAFRDQGEKASNPSQSQGRNSDLIPFPLGLEMPLSLASGY